MLNFDFLWKGLVLASQRILRIIFQETYISCSILLTDHISLSGWLYFLKYLQKSYMTEKIRTIRNLYNKKSF